MFAVIVENDKSQWSDDTGVLYHFPKRYASLLMEGTSVVYYKGRMKDKRFSSERLSLEPHYFGCARIGSIYPDPGSSKGDLFATVNDFQRFAKDVPIRQSTGDYYEVIPINRMGNYWRYGVREMSKATFDALMIDGAPLFEDVQKNQEIDHSNDFESGVEGQPHLRYVTAYERNPKNRRQAIAIHGTTCKACDLNLGERYGVYAEGLIHIHHVEPVSTFETPRKIDPEKDLVPVCPNCHAVIHRKKTSTLSIAELRVMLGSS